MTLDGDPGELTDSNVCKVCHKPMDDHCFKHGLAGYIICPDREGKPPCERTGPASKDVFV